MRRVLVIGCGGAGKSTLARELGRLLGLPVVHLDCLFWKPGWVATPSPEWEGIVAEAVREDRWVMDGNFGATMSLRLEHADTAIFLDFPTYLCLYRVILRWVRHHGKTRPDMAPGCRESIDLEFLGWVRSFRRRSRPQVLARLAEHPEVEVDILRNPKEVERYLREMEQGMGLIAGQ